MKKLLLILGVIVGLCALADKFNPSELYKGIPEVQKTPEGEALQKKLNEHRRQAAERDQRTKEFFQARTTDADMPAFGQTWGRVIVFNEGKKPQVVRARCEQLQAECVAQPGQKAYLDFDFRGAADTLSYRVELLAKDVGGRSFERVGSTSFSAVGGVYQLALFDSRRDVPSDLRPVSGPNLY